MSGLPAWLVLAAALGAAAEDSADLARVRQKLKADFSRAPSLTCLMTVERTVRVAKGSWQAPETAWAEVAFADSRELFAVPGSGVFNHSMLRDVVGEGMSSSGEFLAHALSVFVRGAGTVSPDGEERRDARRLLRFRYSVPVHQSGFRILSAGRMEPVAYEGAFWVDGETLDAVRLRVEVPHPPAWTMALRLVSEIDYQRLSIGGQPLLFPARATTESHDALGPQFRNRTEYSHCREYGASSQISFEEAAPEASAAVATAVASDVRLQEDADVSVEVRTVPARAGEEFEAVLAKPAGPLPAGSTLRGRVRAVRPASDGESVVVLEFLDVRSGRSRCAFFAFPQKLENARGVRLMKETGPAVPGVAALKARQFPASFRIRWRASALKKVVPETPAAPDLDGGLMRPRGR